MSTLQALWTPYPYRAGFCITDDTDAATLPRVKAVYDYLMEMNFPTTKTVWPFKPDDYSGIPALPDSTLRGITLEDEDYFDYCRKLQENGFEIALHGASAGNNRRERIKEAFELMERHFSGSNTYICHSKNAENIYWEEKVTSLPTIKQLLALYSSHESNGEVEESDYFWGDICKEKVRQIRLFRTRKTNTLKANPSMPYHDPQKPYVNSWFSATKRSLKDCADPDGLSRLKAENGLTVLYQYMHRYADARSQELDPGFKEAVQRIGGDSEIWINTTQKVMERLRLIQGIFIVEDGTGFWLINTNQREVSDFQLDSEGKSIAVYNSDLSFEWKGDKLLFPHIPGDSMNYIECDRKVTVCRVRQESVSEEGTCVIDADTAYVLVNTTENSWHYHGLEVPARNFTLEFKRASYEDEKIPLSIIQSSEELQLVFYQIQIILREFMFKGRSVLDNSYLNQEEIELEDHSNW